MTTSVWPQLREIDHVADAARGIDLFDHHQRQPSIGHRQTQAKEEAWKGARQGKPLRRTVDGIRWFRYSISSTEA